MQTRSCRKLAYLPFGFLMVSCNNKLFCYFHRYDPVRLLLTFGASVNKADKFHNNSALHWACSTGNNIAVRLLLDAGGDLNKLNGKVISLD